MRRASTVALVIALSCAASIARAQDDAARPTEGTSGDRTTEPVRPRPHRPPRTRSSDDTTAPRRGSDATSADGASAPSEGDARTRPSDRARTQGDTGRATSADGASGRTSTPADGRARTSTDADAGRLRQSPHRGARPRTDRAGTPAQGDTTRTDRAGTPAQGDATRARTERAGAQTQSDTTRARADRAATQTGSDATRSRTDRAATQTETEATRARPDRSSTQAPADTRPRTDRASADTASDATQPASADGSRAESAATRAEHAGGTDATTAETSPASEVANGAGARQTEGSADTAQQSEVPIGQLVPPAAILDGGVPELDASAALEPDAGPPPEPDAGPPPEPDAGASALAAVPDAGVPAAESSTNPDTGAVETIREWTAWLFEREERQSAERESARRHDSEAPPPEATPHEQPPTAAPASPLDWLRLELPDVRISFVGLLVLLAFTLLWHAIITRFRRGLPERGVVPRLLAIAHLVARLVMVLLSLMLVARLLPGWLHPALLLTVAAVAVALGFGAVWVLLPDIVGGIVILTEARLHPGQWIVGEGFAGTVEQVGPRVTVLRAPDGALLTVPNRRVVKSPVHATDRRWHEVEVVLRAPSGAPAPLVRDAIRDAVLCSPYIPPDPRLTLARDPVDPERWRLKVRLLDMRFSAAFEGQLLERVEEIVART